MSTFRICGFLASIVWLAAPANSQSITTEIVATGLSEPLDLHSPPNDSRLFIAEKTGAIRIIDGGSLLPTPYFDASPLIAVGPFTGLRAFAFHPDYATNGYVYICYDTVDQLMGDVVLDRLTVDPGNPNLLDPASRVEILRVTQTEAWHGGGCMQFGPDGYMYVAFGDGYGHGFDPLCHAQDGSLLLGKMLRLDMDGGFPYAIPATNPFVGDPSIRDEVWHLGLRHPWRFSFDSANGNMFIADVGQVTMEELDFVPAGVGGLNFGWKVMEGTNCIGTSGCTGVAPCNDPSYTEPFLTQLSSQNCSVTGGFVYRGSAIPSEQGNYFFAAYCSGRMWSLKYDGTTITDFAQRNSDFQLNFTNITSIGQDAFGELYTLQQNGTVRKIVPDCAPGSAYCTSNPNSAGTSAVISMSGSASISANNLVIECQLAAPNKPGVFFYGPNQVSIPFGDGVRCVGGQIFRLPPPQFTSGSGIAVRPIDFNAPPTGAGHPGSVFAGSTWNFQFWYRDPQGGPGGFNLSDGLNVTFCP